MKLSRFLKMKEKSEKIRNLGRNRTFFICRHVDLVKGCVIYRDFTPAEATEMGLALRTAFYID